jgi:formylglycine-generating enzyme required for sulfatase activity
MKSELRSDPSALYRPKAVAPRTVSDARRTSMAVWEWTSSSQRPTPFSSGHRAIGEANGKPMCNQRARRWSPPRRVFTLTYRNFFPPDARWQWSGVRLARDIR